MLLRICLSGLLAMPAAAATTVYKWVDESGQVSFSDQPPSAVQEVQTLHLDIPAPVDAELTERRLTQMREVTDRMAADRREREKVRAEQRQARQLVTQVEQPVY